MKNEVRLPIRTVAEIIRNEQQRLQRERRMAAIWKEAAKKWRWIALETGVNDADQKR